MQRSDDNKYRERKKRMKITSKQQQQLKKMHTIFVLLLSFTWERAMVLRWHEVTMWKVCNNLPEWVYALLLQMRQSFVVKKLLELSALYTTRSQYYKIFNKFLLWFCIPFLQIDFSSSKLMQMISLDHIIKLESLLCTQYNNRKFQYLFLHFNFSFLYIFFDDKVKLTNRRIFYTAQIKHSDWKREFWIRTCLRALKTTTNNENFSNI